MTRGCFGALRLAAARPLHYLRVRPQCDFSILGFFWFLVCYAATQLATQLRQRCIKVGRDRIDSSCIESIFWNLLPELNASVHLRLHKASVGWEGENLEGWRKAGDERPQCERWQHVAGTMPDPCAACCSSVRSRWGRVPRRHRAQAA